MANLLGTKIKALRTKKDLTLAQLAACIGSGKSYIWEIENKGLKRPSAEKLTAIAKALDVTTEYLLDNEKTEVSDDLRKEVFFRKLDQLDPQDQHRIMDMIDAWSKKS